MQQDVPYVLWYDNYPKIYIILTKALSLKYNYLYYKNLKFKLSNAKCEITILFLTYKSDSMSIMLWLFL